MRTCFNQRRLEKQSDQADIQPGESSIAKHESKRTNCTYHEDQLRHGPGLARSSQKRPTGVREIVKPV